MAKIVVADDDADIRELVAFKLQQTGHEVVAVGDGAAAVEACQADVPDLVVLDVMMPGMSGLDACRALRLDAALAKVPVILLTARAQEADIEQGFNAGADDYVVKPFTIAQLDARLRAVLRRVNMDDDVPLVVGGLRIDVAARVATLDGVEIDLARKEFDLLAHLAAQPGKVVTKRELLAEIWDLPYGGGDKTVDVHLSWLRRKLGETAAAPRYLRAVRGVGVKLVPPEQ
jgi:two-component system KDP operon response regulator KdpE